MLQALGSTTKTKISCAMFGGCCFLIAGAILVSRMERIEFDESYAYCATVYYSPKTGYRIEYWGQRNDFEKISTGCSRACFKDRKTTNGLSFLEIETQSGYKDQHQAVSAGILEGSLTWRSIYAQWRNTVEAFCERDEENRQFCQWLRDIVETNYLNVMKLARETHKKDHYHHQIYLFYQQLMGIEVGFKKGVRRARQDYEIPFTDFLLLNSRVDIEDLKIYYNEFLADNDDDRMAVNPRVGKMVLNILLKEEGKKPEVLIGHSSDGDYSSMLKVVKTYRFNYHHSPEAGSRLVTNTDITFTSYPGSIASSDDFYLAIGKHTRVIVAGITLKHHESPQLLHGIDLEGTVFSAARVMAANRLSHNGKFWSRIMARDPDLGAKQWLVIDEKRIKYLSLDSTADLNEVVTSSTTTEDGITNVIINEIPQDMLTSVDLVRDTSPPSNRNLIWLVDQTWRRLHAEDVTNMFRNGDHGWTLDGTPFFKVIQELTGLQPKSLKASNKLMSLEDIAQFLKLNSYRGDLLIEPITFGNVDLKLYTSEDHELIVQNGPITTNSTRPFDWNADLFADIQHDEHPVLWDFSPIQVQFLWD